VPYIQYPYIPFYILYPLLLPQQTPEEELVVLEDNKKALKEDLRGL